MSKLTGFMLLLINALLIVALAVYAKKSADYKAMVPFLIQGEVLPGLDFYDGSGQALSIRHLKEKPMLLFVFERPCSTCTPNISFWNKLNEIANEKADVFGVIQELHEMFELVENNKLPFRLIAPKSFDEFRKKWRVYMNLSQTYLVHQGKVKLVRVGDINPDDIKGIVNEISRLGGT